jgi:uncharacterized phage-associated protein
MYDSILIAKYIAKRCNELGLSYNVTKVQKLMYLSYAKAFKDHNIQLIKEVPIALQYGPVFSSTLKIMQPDPESWDKKEEKENIHLDPITSRIIDSALQSKYGKMSATKLVEWSHEKNSPWDIIFRNVIEIGYKKVLDI